MIIDDQESVSHVRDPEKLPENAELVEKLLESRPGMSLAEVKQSFTEIQDLTDKTKKIQALEFLKTRVTAFLINLDRIQDNPEVTQPQKQKALNLATEYAEPLQEILRELFEAES